MFTLQFSTDNDSFADNPAVEIATILRKVATIAATGQTDGLVRDTSGNTIGKWEIVETEVYHE